MKLREIAHSRSGDKGDVANISVIAFDATDYDFLCEQVTTERVAHLLRGIVKGSVTRYELPKIAALNFVLTNALGGGVLRSLALDTHGKALSSALLMLDLPDRNTSDNPS